MKKLISILLVLVLALGLMATAALAADVDVSDAEAAKGESVTIEVKATGVSAFSSCLATLTYDHAVLELTALNAEGFALDGFNVNNVVSNGETKTGLEDYQDGQPMVATNIATGMIAYATGGSSAADGVLFTATFKVLDTAEVEKTTVTATVSMADADGKDVLKEVAASGDVTVSASGTIPGDVNGDKIVDAKDRTLIARFVAGWTVNNFDEKAANVNGDSTIDAKDRTLISRYVAGWSVTLK